MGGPVGANGALVDATMGGSAGGSAMSDGGSVESTAIGVVVTTIGASDGTAVIGAAVIGLLVGSLVG